MFFFAKDAVHVAVKERTKNVCFIIRDGVNMTCEKCCRWPCDQTNSNCGNAYYIKDIHGNEVMVVEISPALRKVLSDCVIEALETEV